MEWDSQALDEFINMHITISLKEGANVFADKVARKNRSDKVTLKEIEETKKVYFAVPEEVRNKELEKRIAEGETDLRERMVEEARDILAREIDLFNVEICHARSFRCQSAPDDTSSDISSVPWLPCARKEQSALAALCPLP